LSGRLECAFQRRAGTLPVPGPCRAHERPCLCANELIIFGQRRTERLGRLNGARRLGGNHEPPSTASHRLGARTAPPHTHTHTQTNTRPALCCLAWTDLDCFLLLLLATFRRHSHWSPLNRQTPSKRFLAVSLEPAGAQVLAISDHSRATAAAKLDRFRQTIVWSGRALASVRSLARAGQAGLAGLDDAAAAVSNANVRQTAGVL
jgi:hypothetical protein